MAAQIQPTIGFTIASRPRCPPAGSMFITDRYRSSNSELRTAGVPIGSRWRSYWFMRGLRMPRSRPPRDTPTRATDRLAVRLAHLVDAENVSV